MNHADSQSGYFGAMLLSQEGYAKPLRWLIEAKADVNKQDARGLTCLMRGAKTGALNCVKILVEHEVFSKG